MFGGVWGESQQQEGKLFKGRIIVLKQGGKAGWLAGEIQWADLKGLGLIEVLVQATADDGLQPVKGELEVGGAGRHKPSCWRK
ncbi:MAG: hypothetical protein D3908_12920 [Candidatus Electrothrix sp. AUS4]|nr:hypothetical protein [Candidatus Electrothrix sp. AUS4]